MIIFDQIHFLKLHWFHRLEVSMIGFKTKHRTTNKILKDIKKARRENDEADRWMDEYLKEIDYQVIHNDSLLGIAF